MHEDGAFLPDTPESSSVELQRFQHAPSLNRRHAVRLTGEAALGVRDGLVRATSEGVRLTRRARPGEVYRLVPPKHLADGIRDGTLRAATPMRGDASVLIKNASSGRIAGKADLKRVKPNALKILGPAAWQAMALATQQHYLVEIASKLDGLQAGIDEVLARMDDAHVGKLNHLREKADDAIATLGRDGTLSPARIADLRHAADDAKALWHELARTSRRHLDEYRQGTISAAAVEKTFALLAQSTQVLAHCSDALMAVPYASTHELEQVFQEERDRMLPALPDFRNLLDNLLAASSAWETQHADFELRRPKKRAPRLVNAITPLPIHIGPRRPVQEPLHDATRWRYERSAELDDAQPPALLVEVLDGGDVLLHQELAETDTP